MASLKRSLSADRLKQPMIRKNGKLEGKRLDMTAVGAKRTIALSVVTRAGVASDLQWALGGQRSYSIQELSVDAQ